MKRKYRFKFYFWLGFILIALRCIATIIASENTKMQLYNRGYEYDDVKIFLKIRNIGLSNFLEDELIQKDYADWRDGTFVGVDLR